MNEGRNEGRRDLGATIAGQELTDEALIRALLVFDDKTLRFLALAEALVRARFDLRNFIADVFGRTWEFKIVQCLLTSGPMNKSQLSCRLFPNLVTSHYRLSRGPVWKAFNELLSKGVLNATETGGRGTTYCLSPVYRPVMELLVSRDETVLHNNPS